MPGNPNPENESDVRGALGELKRIRAQKEEELSTFERLARLYDRESRKIGAGLNVWYAQEKNMGHALNAVDRAYKSRKREFEKMEGNAESNALPLKRLVKGVVDNSLGW